MDPVARTAFWIAEARAVESARPDRLFDDPFALPLLGRAAPAPPDGTPAQAAARQAYLAIRVRYLDDLLRARAAGGVRQVVVLAAGLDSRAFRLDWPPGTRLFEADRAEVFAHKEPILRASGAALRCGRVIVPIDLRDDWPPALVAAGYDPARPAFFLLEGLLPYLCPDDVAQLLRACHAASAPGSALACDVPNHAMLHSDYTADYMRRLADLGAPWLFGTDDPEGVFAAAGWRAAAVRAGDPGADFGRWPYPPVPRALPGIPATFFVTAERA